MKQWLRDGIKSKRMERSPLQGSGKVFEVLNELKNSTQLGELGLFDGKVFTLQQYFKRKNDLFIATNVNYILKSAKTINR